MKNIFEGKSTVLFQGDSITDCGWNREKADDLGSGYPSKIAKIWDVLFPGSGTKFLNRGISGNRTRDLLVRYENDFAALKPDVVSILIGINDVWRRYDSNDPTSTEQFEKNYRTLLENLRRDLKAAIVIIEPFLLGSDPAKDCYREDLDPKIQVVRKLAMQYADAFLPLDGIFASYAAQGWKETAMSGDGVHPADAGHGIIAAEWLKLLGAI